MNSFLNKFDQLKLLCKNTIDVLLVLTETKLDDSFSSCQFHIEDCSILQREDKNDNGGGVWYWHKRQYFNIKDKHVLPVDIKTLFIELIFRESKWLLAATY